MKDAANKALIVGATGGIEGEVAWTLLGCGWEVRAIHRDRANAAASNAGPHWVRGDAMDRASGEREADSMAVIIHGPNSPGHRNWAGLALPKLDDTIAAAVENGARVALPGTVYN